MMHWVRRGLIFDPGLYDLGEGGVGYAQGPQALVFENFVRIYFSTRRLSDNGKFVSCIRFADFDKGFKNVINVCADTIINDGRLGTFDEHGIFPMNVVRADDRILAYTCGWSRRISVSIDMAIGIAESHDGGNSFQRLGDGPVLAASPSEPFLVGDPFVQRRDDLFHMWYIFGTAWKSPAEGLPPERTYKISHAVSSDGLSWTREGGRQIIPDRLGVTESQALPTVITMGGIHHMYFCYRESVDFRKNPARSYRIGHAWSRDMVEWTRDDDPISIGAGGEWDSEMQCYPHVFESEGEIYLLYNGNDFGRRGFGLAQLEKRGVVL
jgi:hypothetical protein